jgi:hypothetical protein
MNCDTGHIRNYPFNENPPHGYTPLPDSLAPAARKVMGDRDEGQVSLTSGGKLSKWAAKERKLRHKKANASRRRNRK